MLVTPLTKVIGYDLASKVALNAYNKNISLMQSCLELTDLSEKVFKPFRVHFWLYDYIFLINFLIEKITNYKHDKFLDFGCGDGRFIYDFQKKTDKELQTIKSEKKYL